MATADSVKTKIQALISLANATTGGNALTLTDAVNALIAGYGGGGGTQYLHTIEMPADEYGANEGTLTFTKIDGNSSPIATFDDGTGTYNVIGWTATWHGTTYEVIGCGNDDYGEYCLYDGDGGDCHITTSGYDDYTETVTEYGGDDETFTFTYYVETTGDGGEFTCPKSYTWEQFINSEYNVGGVFMDDTGGGVMDNDCNAISASLDDLVYDTFGGGSGGSTELSVTINGKSYPITAGMTWGDFIQEHSEFYTDYTCYYPPCCNSELYLDDVIILDDGENYTMLNGSDGSLPLYSTVINPYIEYGSYSTAIFDILHT